MSDNEEEKLFSDETANTDDTSVPLLLSDKVKLKYMDTIMFYVLRLTPENDNYGLEEVKDFLEDLSIKKIWFVSEEKSKKAVKHYHAVFAYPIGLDPRDEIKKWLVSKFPGTWKKQDGNKRYNLQESSNKDNAFMYASKDGDYFYGEGINPEYIKYVNSKSFQKKDTRVGLLMSSREQYIKDKINDRQLFDIVCKICIDTSSTGSLNMTYVKSFMTGAKASKDPEYKDKLFKDMFK